MRVLKSSTVKSNSHKEVRVPFKTSKVELEDCDWSTDPAPGPRISEKKRGLVLSGSPWCRGLEISGPT